MFAAPDPPVGARGPLPRMAPLFGRPNSKVDSTRSGLGSRQCQGDVAAWCGGWILITWCLAHSVAAACGLASMRFVGIRCEGPAGVT